MGLIIPRRSRRSCKLALTSPTARWDHLALQMVDLVASRGTVCDNAHKSTVTWSVETPNLLMQTWNWATFGDEINTVTSVFSIDTKTKLDISWLFSKWFGPKIIDMDHKRGGVLVDFWDTPYRLENLNLLSLILFHNFKTLTPFFTARPKGTWLWLIPV